MDLAQFIFGVLTVISAVAVVACKKPLHSALSLVATLFLVAVHFAMMNAHFVAAIQVLVYAGAIMVLVVFVIMLLGPDAESKEQPKTGVSAAAAIFTGLFVALVGAVIVQQFANLPSQLDVPAVDGSTAGIGAALFSRFVYPFEVTSLLILAAIIGAVVLGMESKRPLRPGRGLAAKQK